MPNVRWLCTGKLAPWIGVALVLLVLFVRKPDSFVHPQFWAEDGSIFFAQQVEQGAAAHLRPYAGYFNEVPRIVASLATLLPHRLAPAVYNYSALLVLAVLILKLYSPRLRLSEDLWPCPLPFALAVALVPHPGGEIFACLANVQWVLALLLLVLAVQKSAATTAEAAGDALLVLLAGLTGPFVFFALPLLGWKQWRHKSRYDLPALGVALAATALQLWALRHSSIEAPPPTPAGPGIWYQLVGHRLFGTLFVGPQITYLLDPVFMAAAGFVVLAGILWLLRRSPVAFERTGLSYLFAAAVIAGAFSKYGRAPGLLLPWGNAARYFYIPAVVLAWSLLLVLATARGLTPRLLAAAALATVLSASALSAFLSPPLEDLRWEEQAERVGGPEAELWIPINPPGWMIHISQAPPAD